MEKWVNILQTQINGAIISAIYDMVLPEIQNIICNLNLDQIDIIRVRHQLSKVSVTLGKNRIHDLFMMTGDNSFQQLISEFFTRRFHSQPDLQKQKSWPRHVDGYNPTCTRAYHA